jgi:hypothetical protein
VMKEQRSAYKSYIEKITLNLLLNYPDQNISNQFKPKKLRLKISIRIRTGAVCSFNSLRILPLMLSGPQISCVLILCRSFFTPGRDIGSAVFRVWVFI